MANRNLIKTKFTAIIILVCINLIFTSEFLYDNSSRNLQQQQYVEYSNNGVFYTLNYPKNDITGTGDKLQDSPYKVLCILKACPGGCCIGEINNLQCETAENCKMYFDSTRKGNVAAAVIIPIVVTAIFLIAFFLLRKYYNKASLFYIALLSFICMLVITIPFVILYLIKAQPFGECTSKGERYFKTNISKN